jgi:arabinogalactan oligomer/maltooligosaccharide transport system permease protein
MSVGLYSFVQDKYAQQWGTFCAGVVLAAIPVVIIFFFLQRFIAEGLTRGAVKG